MNKNEAKELLADFAERIYKEFKESQEEHNELFHDGDELSLQYVHEETMQPADIASVFLRVAEKMRKEVQEREVGDPNIVADSFTEERLKILKERQDDLFLRMGKLEAQLKALQTKLESIEECPCLI